MCIRDITRLLPPTNHVFCGKLPGHVTPCGLPQQPTNVFSVPVGLSRADALLGLVSVVANPNGSKVSVSVLLITCVWTTDPSYCGLESANKYIARAYSFIISQPPVNHGQLTLFIPLWV